MKRTGSIRSWVGPAVMSTRRRVRVCSVIIRSAAAKMSSGSSIRPVPVVPQARGPSAQGRTVTCGKPASVSRLCCRAGCAYILSFIAGAMSTGQVMARNVVERASSAMPLAILPMLFAVAGATIIRSAQSGSEICSVEWSLVGANTSL